MTKLLNLNNEKLFEELYYNQQVVGVEEGIYFNSVDVTVKFGNDDILEYAEEKGETFDNIKREDYDEEYDYLQDYLDQIYEYYQSHEEEIDRHFFMKQIDEVRDQLENL